MNEKTVFRCIWKDGVDEENGVYILWTDNTWEYIPVKAKSWKTYIRRFSFKSVMNTGHMTRNHFNRKQVLEYLSYRASIWNDLLKEHNKKSKES